MPDALHPPAKGKHRGFSPVKGKHRGAPLWSRPPDLPRYVALARRSRTVAHRGFSSVKGKPLGGDLRLSPPFFSLLCPLTPETCP